jgi:hypothetical protein
MRIVAILCCAAVMLGTTHRPAHRTHTAGKRVLPIALVINGTTLAANPPPLIVHDRVLVPVRRILTALGLSFLKDGPVVRTYAGANAVTIAETTEIKYTLYAPLRFLTSALGAQAVYDRQTNSVEITSTLLGRTGNGIVERDGGVREMGTITAIDLNSTPATLTLTYNASVRTLQIRPDAKVLVQDVSTGTDNFGEVQDVHVGDYAQLQLDEGGQVKQIVDAYGSRTGSVAAAGAGEIVLGDGHVITPSRDTTVTLNGEAATIDDLGVGDDVMVLYNIDSSEPRQIIATRASASEGDAETARGAVAITAIDVSPSGPLRAGETLRVALHGTPGGGVAHYDLGPYVRNQGLQETSPGVYTGSYLVHPGINFADAPIFGHLTVGGIDAPQTVSTATVSIATEPPGIDDFAPDNGATVNNVRPGIYATFAAGTVPVDSSSAKIVVNGRDVTASSLRTSRFIEYLPGIDYPPGPMHVLVQVSDAAGNVATKAWVFFIKGE